MTTKKKTGLGRGLNTLIPSAPAKDAESEKILKKRGADKIGDYGTDTESRTKSRSAQETVR